MKPSLSRLSRRQLLLGGGALAALAAAGIAYEAALPGPAAGRKILSPGEEPIIAALAEALFPSGSGLGIGTPELAAQGVDVVGEVDRILAGLEEEPVMGFRYFLRALEQGALIGQQQWFSRMSLPDRLEVVRIWAEPGVVPRRLGLDLLRTVVGMAVLSQPAVLAVIGWEPGCPSISA